MTNTWNEVAKEIEIGRFLLFSRKKQLGGMDRIKGAFRTYSTPAMEPF